MAEATRKQSLYGAISDRMAAEQSAHSGPIIVVGLPRSGTTWIGKIFDSHPRTLYLHEPDSAVPINELSLIENSVPPQPDAERIRAALARTIGVRATRVAATFPRFRKVYRNPPLDWLHRQLSLGAKVWSRYFFEAQVPDLLGSSLQPSARVVWKSIESVGRIGLLSRLLPDVRVLHILRHPGGWINSQNRGTSEHRFACDRDDWWRFDLLEKTPPARRRGLSAHSFQQMTDLERDVWSWILWNENGAEACEGLRNVITIRYEDLCAAPIDESRRMFEFVGLEWHPQTENFIRRSVTIHREAYYSVFRDPSIAANKWRESISVEDLAVVESILGQSRIGRMFLPAADNLDSACSGNS